MQKKIYVAGMFDPDTAGKVDAAVRAVAGVSNVVANLVKTGNILTGLSVAAVNGENTFGIVQVSS